MAFTPMSEQRFKQEAGGYAYYHASSSFQRLRNKDKAQVYSRELLYPTVRDPNYLVLRERRRLFSDFIQKLPNKKLLVLDVGGRLQPFRALLESRLALYIAIDPVLEGLLSVLAVGESIPFAGEAFDLAICTQVLPYVSDPQLVISEIHRVLKKGAYLFLSAPAIFPRYHNMRWCFMPDGFHKLLSSFSEAKIIPEGGSIAGLCRTLNLFLDTYIRSERAKGLASYTLFPLINLVGLLLDRVSRGKTEFTSNYTCIARK